MPNPIGKPPGFLSQNLAISEIRASLISITKVSSQKEASFKKQS